MTRMPFIDLHMHSTASDGTTNPADLPALARQADLTAIALTDHDTTLGHDACAKACTAAGIEFIPGIELSCDRGKPRGAMHLLGYFIQSDTPALQQVMEQLWLARAQRAPLVIQKLNDLGLQISLTQVQDTAGIAMIGRPHIAAVLVEQGYAATITDAFDRYLGYGRPGYVRKDNLPTDLAISAIHAAGGLAVLAHPVQLKCDDDAELLSLLNSLKDQGLDGIEAMHTDHSPALAAEYQHLAASLGLLVTGGSDYHGSRKPIALGSQPVPIHWLSLLRSALAH